MHVNYGMHVLPRDSELFTDEQRNYLILVAWCWILSWCFTFVYKMTKAKTILGCLCVQVIIILCTVHNHFLCHCWSPWVLNFCSVALQSENVVIKDKSFPEFNLNPKSLHSNFNVICCFDLLDALLRILFQI